MKKVLFILLLLGSAICLTQCKKNKPAPVPPPAEDSTLNPGPGRYIIRTRYICPDGGGFILGNFSNNEVLLWQHASPAEVRDIKADNAGYNTYIWNVQEIRARPDFSIPDPANPSPTRIVGYSFYQHLPSGEYAMLAMGRPSDSPDDQLAIGNGPSMSLSPTINFSELPDSIITGKSQSYIAAHPDYFNEPSTVFKLSHPTDSTYRITNNGTKYWFNLYGWSHWYISATAKANGSNCDQYDQRPAMRRSILGTNTTFIPDPNNPYYIPDVPYLTQLVLEKVD